jgi:endonuclease YncB( thermonuclease family)
MQRYFVRKFQVAGLLAAAFVGFWIYSEGIGYLFPPVSIQSAANNGIVGRASVIDADTFEIDGQRIRLWGVDAPERE